MPNPLLQNSSCEDLGVKATGKFRDILFPTDFSKASEAIADHAVGIAKATESRILILSVTPRLEQWHGASEMYFGPVSDAALAGFEKERKVLETERLCMLQRFQANHFALADSDVLVRSGGVAEQIIEAAQEKDVGLIMMPTQAMGRRRQFLIGSTAAKVLHDAPCPVWTSPHPRELDSFRPYRNIVIAIDYRSLSGALLLRASEFAARFGANLSVFSAIPTAPEADLQLVHKLKKALNSALEEQLSQSKIKASINLLEGNPGDVIWEVAEDIERADLIITGRGRLDETAGHLHSQNYEIIWNAPCPVITL
jgi:nucleotide-binding universal stress UspA family protein